MTLPEHTGYMEFSPEEIGQHFSSYITDALKERDKLIADLHFEVERLQQELDEADGRIETLAGEVSREAA